MESCGTYTDEMEAFLREHGSGPLLEAMQEQLPRWREEDFPLDGGRNPGYTPFEYITFTDELIQHTLTVQVLTPSPYSWVPGHGSGFTSTQSVTPSSSGPPASWLVSGCVYDTDCVWVLMR